MGRQVRDQLGHRLLIVVKHRPRVAQHQPQRHLLGRTARLGQPADREVIGQIVTNACGLAPPDRRLPERDRRELVEQRPLPRRPMHRVIAMFVDIVIARIGQRMRADIERRSAA